ncbi:type III pantothenate kinase [Paradesertivirga mongoliensis]|uniref:Type III pantothenate kinase n=1 Tax=Paradesertivirga mongoliensis TaxID=2100740 RepID=A0ABW4ZII6_9SPHI|nr:type III pantothenate kinase [Pedobacter mongoliensis]
MTNLVIDIGNTFSKLAIFNNRKLSSFLQIDNFSPPYLRNFLDEQPVDNAVISSVNAEVEEFEALLKERVNYQRFSGLTSTKVINHYKTPETLGLDRYAAVIGAEALYPNQNCLVIDAGSCITYDFIDAGKNYRGGSISPGISMRFKAMNRFTGRLPLVDPNPERHPEYGDDTRSAILSGVQKGVIYEALGFIDSFSKKWNDIKVLLCGGDVNFFDTELKSSIFAHTLKTEPHLVLIGLNEVIHYNND